MAIDYVMLRSAASDATKDMRNDVRKIANDFSSALQRVRQLEQQFYDLRDHASRLSRFENYLNTLTDDLKYLHQKIDQLSQQLQNVEAKVS